MVEFFQKAKKLFISSLLPILISLILIAAVIYAWTEPSQAPPTCPAGEPGCDAPLNVGPIGQIKEGGLRLNTGGAANSLYLQGDPVLTTKGLIVEYGNVGIGKTNPGYKLHVSNGDSYFENNAIVMDLLSLGTTSAPPPAVDAVETSLYVGGRALFGLGGGTYIGGGGASNSINGVWNTADDNAQLWINNTGYRAGQDYFRDTIIADGKGSSILFVDGSDASVRIGGATAATLTSIKRHIFSWNPSSLNNGEMEYSTRTLPDGCFFIPGPPPQSSCSGGFGYIYSWGNMEQSTASWLTGTIIHNNSLNTDRNITVSAFNATGATCDDTAKIWEYMCIYD